MAGGAAEFDGTAGNNALGFSYDAATRKGFITTNTNWTMNFGGAKIGFVVDRFLHRSKEKLERGDVVVIHQNASGPLFGGSNQNSPDRGRARHQSFRSARLRRNR